MGDVVVVTVEFRLGPLGFLGHPAFDGAGGTLGFADQQAALRWVRDEIAAFGGDPLRVTLGGESGGSIGTCAQLVSPGARDLIDGALLQSGSCGGNSIFVVPQDQAAEQANAVAARLGCTDPQVAAACLRALPVEQVVPGGAEVIAAAWGGPLLPRAPQEVLSDPATIAQVPVLSGHNRDEGTVFAQTQEIYGAPVTEASIAGQLTSDFGDAALADAALAGYPASDYPSAAYRYGAIRGDEAFACPQRRLDDDLARRAQPVYAYEFADRTSPGYVPILAGFEDVGASHAAELPYLFDFTNKPIDFSGNPRPLTAAQRALGDRMIETWVRFLRDGDPGWAPWTADAPTVQGFASESDGGVRAVDAASWHRCGVWS